MSRPTPPLPSPLAHAYILAGGSQEARRDLAKKMTAAYLCEGQRPPCGRCLPCEKVEKGIHPDVALLAPAEGRRDIVADQARALRSDAYIRPNEGKRKVYVIDPADAMNQAAQNALLKVLEDGPEYTAFLLLTGQPGQLLGTIRSRCETLTLPPEEEQQDPELERRGAQLAQLLLTGSEWELAQGLTALELEKWKADQLLDLLAAAEPFVAADLAQNRRAAQVHQVLKACRDSGAYNVGAGHTLGWLCAELFR